VPLGQVTELCGLAGSGKTQMALQLCLDVQIPALLFAGVATMFASNPAVHAAMNTRWAAARAMLTQLPDFAVRRIDVVGASPMVEAELKLALPGWKGFIGYADLVARHRPTGAATHRTG
jgi:hypothetical protein